MLWEDDASTIPGDAHPVSAAAPNTTAPARISDSNFVMTVFMISSEFNMKSRNPLNKFGSPSSRRKKLSLPSDATQHVLNIGRGKEKSSNFVNYSRL